MKVRNDELSDDDRASLVEFLDGALDEAASDALQRRLEREPALARAAEELFTSEALLREIARRGGSALDASAVAARRRRFFRVTLGLAAAAAVVALLALFVTRHAARSPAVIELAVVPSFESAREHVAAHPELAGLRPPGLDDLRGANVAPNVAADEFVARAARLADTAHADRGVRYFQLAGTSSVPRVAVALAFPAHGEPFQLAAAGEPDAAREWIVGPGAFELPSASYDVFTDRSGARFVEYHRGFLVPIGSGALDVVLALREAPLDDALRAEIAARLALADAQSSIDAWLAARGFTTAHARVVESR